MPYTTDFKPDDIVRVKRERAPQFVYPLRKWVADGRTARVLSTWTSDNRALVKIGFIPKRKPKNPRSLHFVFAPSELERAE